MHNLEMQLRNWQPNVNTDLPTQAADRIARLEAALQPFKAILEEAAEADEIDESVNIAISMSHLKQAASLLEE